MFWPRGDFKSRMKTLQFPPPPLHQQAVFYLMEQTHLTSLHHHLLQPESSKSTINWCPAVVFARLKTKGSCDSFKGASTMLQDKFAFMHHGRGHQDTQADKWQEAARTRTKQRHDRKESSARLTKAPTRTAEKEEQQLYGHVFLGTECKIQVFDCMSQK